MFRRPSIVAVATVTSVLALSACSNPIDSVLDGAVEDVVEEGIEQATGVDVEVGDDVSLPDDFPSDVPVPDGQLTSSFAVSGAFQLTYTLADESAADALADEVAAMPGMELTSEGEVADLKSWAFESETYFIAITLLKSDSSIDLSYMVSPASE